MVFAFVTLRVHVVLFALWFTFASGFDKCKTSVEGVDYDFTALAAYIQANYPNYYITGSDGNKYFYLPCQAQSNPNCKDKVPGQQPAACQQDQGGAWHSLGNWDSITYNPLTGGGKGAILSASGGDGNPSRKMEINYICDSSAGFGELKFMNEVSNDYSFEWRSTCVCPGACSKHGGDGGGDGPEISGGWIFIIILISCIVLYLVGGVLYNKFKNHATGIELIPNVAFWIALPGLVKDGHLYIYKKCRSLCGERYEVV